MVNQGRGPGQRLDPSRRPTKAERKEQARVEREQIQQKIAARRRNRRIGIAGTVALVALVVVVVALTAGGGGGTATPSDVTALPGMLTTPPPWPANTAQLRERLGQLGLPGTSDTINHHHAWLQIYVDGQQQTIPADIGIDQATSAFSPLHTHDTTGQLHVEPDTTDFTGTLGQFFDVWGVRLTSDCIGAMCDAGDSTLRAFVDGKAYDGDPRTIPLTDGSMIVLAYGVSSQVPSPIPSSPPTG